MDRTGFLGLAGLNTTDQLRKTIRRKQSLVMKTLRLSPPVLLLIAAITQASAQSLYWDIDGATAGAGGATPAGFWDAVTANWSTDSLGASTGGVWTDGLTAVFAAGTDATGAYTVTVSGTQSPVGINFEEGTVTLNGGDIHFGGSAVMDVASGLTATIGSVLSGGSAPLSKTGTGTLVLSGANTFSNTFSMAGGTLRMGALGDILPAAALSLASGSTLDLNSLSTGIGSLAGVSGSSVTLGSGTLTNLGVGANTVFSGAISGSGGVVKAGGNFLTLNGASSFSGKTVVTGGLLAINSDASLGTAPGAYVADQLVLDGGALRLTVSAVSIPVNRGITVGAGGGVLEVSSGQTATNNANIVGPGSLTKANAGNINLNGTNTFAGNFNVTGGGIRFNTDIAAGTGTIVVTPASIVTLRNISPFVTVSTVTNPMTLNANGAFDVDLTAASGNTFILSGPISGVGYLTRGRATGAGGNVVLSGDNSGWSGGLALFRRGTLTLGHRNALGTGATYITPGDSNPLALQAATPLTGANAVATPINIAITNAHFSIGGTNALELSGPINLGSASVTITNVNTAPTILSGVISSGAGVGLTKDGAGTMTLSGASTYSGATTVNAGTLLINAPGSIGPNSVTVKTNATLGGSGTVSGPVTVESGGSIGAGASAGALTLTGGLNLSAGGTNVWELAADSTSNPGTDFDQIVLTGGNLALGGSSRLLVKFNASFPASSNAFWLANHSWTIISLSGAATNQGSTTFASLLGTNGITVGAFSTSVDGSGSVFLNYTTSATAPAPPPQIISIAGAGTTSVTVTWSNVVVGTNYVLQFNTNLSTTNWTGLSPVTAMGSTASKTDNPPAGDAARYYRVLVQ